MVEDLGVELGKLLQVRDRVGNGVLLAEVLLALEQRGGTPAINFLETLCEV